MKNPWKEIKHILQKRPNNTSNAIIDNNATLIDPTAIGNAFKDIVRSFSIFY